MKTIATLLLLTASLAVCQQVNQGIIPASTGLSLGTPTQRWNGYFQNINVPNINGAIHLDGVVYATLATAVAACPVSGTVVVDKPGTWLVSSNLTLPSTCNLIVYQGAVISLNGG